MAHPNLKALALLCAGALLGVPLGVAYERANPALAPGGSDLAAPPAAPESQRPAPEAPGAGPSPLPLLDSIVGSDRMVVPGKAPVATASPTLEIPRAEPPPKPDGVRFLLLTPAGPLVVETRIKIDGTPLAVIRERMVDEMLADADTNRDGRSTWDEAVRNPQFAGGLFTGFLQQELADRSRPAGPALAERKDSNRNGLIDRDEARSMCQGASPAIHFDANPRFAAHARDLFDTCDVDGDGSLSKQEVENSVERIRLRDKNANELIEPAECEPLPPAVWKRGHREEGEDTLAAHPSSIYLLYPGVPSQPVLTPRDEAILKLTFDDRYRFGKAAQRNYKLIGRSRASDLWDALQEGANDAQKLASAKAHLELVWEFSEGADTTRLAARQAIPLLQRQLRQNNDKELELALPGMAVLFDANNLPPERDAAAAIVGMIAQADADGNGYLDRKEFERLQGFAFEALDGNSDGKVQLDEARAYVSSRRNMNRGSFTLSVGEAALPVFTLLDANFDHMLSWREVQSAPIRLQGLDLDRNGSIDRDEVPVTAAVTLRRGYGPRPKPLPTPVPPAARPGDWFANMDRNGDGDISRREFLGTEAQFEAADTDRDGLLSREEARKAPAVP